MNQTNLILCYLLLSIQISSFKKLIESKLLDLISSLKSVNLI